MQPQPTADDDTIRWLLADERRCPACGSAIQPDDQRCGACERALFIRTWAPRRSTALTSLVWAWCLCTIVAALLALGATAQLAGWLAPAQPEPPSQIVRSLARLVGVQAFDAPIESSPPPGWFIPLMVAIGIVGGSIAYGLWARHIWALWSALAVSSVPVVVGAFLSLRAQGVAAIALLTLGLVIAIVAALLHLGVADEVRGEWRAVAIGPTANSSAALYDEGHSAIKAGLTFLAARCWAQAIARDPTSIASMHALALVLARLNHHRRALALIEQALAHAPQHPELLATAAILRRSMPDA